jgi:hypothetical protein
LELPFTTFDGEELYTSVEEKISVLVYYLIINNGL